LADAETELDQRRTALLKQKLVLVLGSSRAYDVEFAEPSSSKVPDAVRAMTKKGATKAAFIESSRAIANYLFEEHVGNVSPGLLCVIEIRMRGSRGIVLMKLEREAGAQLEEKIVSGKRSFEMSVLDNLVLTEGTKLFKSALFLREDGDSFRSVACDSQLSSAAVESMAKFWLRFLGCRFVTDPRVATKSFFEAAVRTISEVIDDPTAKAQAFDSLHSELNSSRKTFAPKTYIDDYILETYRVAFQARLKEMKVPLQQFHKDNTDIASKLRRRTYKTARGATVTVSEEDANLVDVEKDKVIVNDSVVKVS